MNDKNYKKIEIIAWSVVAIILTIFLVMTLKKDVFSINDMFNNTSNQNMKVIKTYTVKDVEKFKDINIDVNQGEIELLESKDNNIYIALKSNKNMKNADYLNLDENTDKLDITSKKGSKIHFLNNTSIKIEIQIPKSYNKNISIETDAGDVIANKNLNLNNLNITSNVGDVELNKNIKCKKFNIVNDTGDIDVTSIDGSGSITSDVGDIDCNIEGLNQDIDITSDIGDIELGVNKDLSFKLDSDKKPTKIDIDLNNISKKGSSFYGEHGQNPSYTIKTHSDVGDVDIEYR